MMDIKIDESELLKLSETEEGVQQIIEFTPDGKLGQIIQIDPSKLGNSVGLDPSKILEAIKLDEPTQLCNEQVIETEITECTSLNEHETHKNAFNVGDNQHVIIVEDEDGAKTLYSLDEEDKPMYRLNEDDDDDEHTMYAAMNDEEKTIYTSKMSEDEPAILRFSSYLEFKRALTEYESHTITKFILRNQSKQFTAPVCLHDILRNEKNSSDLPMIRWEFCAAKDFLPIPFMGIPYITVGKQVFQCHQGKDYNTNKKQQYELRKEILNQATRFQIKSRNKGPSKKLDCPVLFAVRKMYFFPEYPLDSDSKRNRALVAQKLRNRLSRIKNEGCTCKCVTNEDNILTEKTSNGLPGRLEYLTRFPPNTEHNHDVVKAANFMKLQLKKHGSKGVEMLQSKKMVETTPFQYEKHIELISALRASGDLDQLRSARENMASIYPLSEELWLEWFQDELPLAVIPEQKQYIISKFETAVNDYASIKVWHEYCQYMMNNIDSPSDIERARNVFEHAITAVGLHLTEGSSIWDGYREFEIAILDSYQQLQESGDTVGMESKVQAQVERIAAIFKRELSIPLLGSSTTFKSFEDWYSEPIPDETKRLFERALQKLTLLMEYEEKLHTAEGNKLPEYLTYIDYEIEGGDPARIQCIFERAIKDNCLDYDLWEKYTNYMDFKLKIPSIAVRVHERAVRNVPWISKLWQNYLKALERNSANLETHSNVFNQSLKGGFSGAESYLQLWLTRCDYYRRRVTDWNFEEDKIEALHKAFEKGVTYMNHYFGLEGDKYCLLLREWAFIEAKYLQNVKRAQELWDTVMKKHSRDPAMWLEYIHFLMLFTDVVTVRRVFQRAVQISMEQPEIICDAFMKFERHYGMLQDIDDAQQKIDVQIKRAKERRAKESIKDNSVILCDRKKLKHKFGKNADDHGKKRKKKKPEKEKNPQKRNNETKSEIEPVPKKQFTDSDSQNLICMEESNFPLLTSLGAPSEIPELKMAATIPTSTQSELTFDEAPVANINPVIQTTGEFTNEDVTSVKHAPMDDMFADDVKNGEKSNNNGNSVTFEDETSNNKSEEHIEISKVDNDLSVFLSNLLFSVEENHLREMFTPCGEIERIHLVTNKVGKSKGFAYLQFKQQESVNEALKLDRQTLLSRPVFVSRCVDKKENPTQFKFPTSLDKHTLYVSNLPFELNSDEVKEHFAQAGELKQVRLVTNRSGKSKGYAYVEYESETVAAAAIMKFDKQMLKGRPINVALSNPPARKQNQPEPNVQQFKPKIQEIPGSRGKSKTQIALVPRALQKAAVTPPSQELTASTSAPAEAAPSAMSNADFRKFLSK